jgi:hypothetical protein
MTLAKKQSRQNLIEYSPSGGKSYVSCAEFTNAMNSRPLSSRPDETETTDSELHIVQNQGALQSWT